MPHRTGRGANEHGTAAGLTRHDEATAVSVIRLSLDRGNAKPRPLTFATIVAVIPQRVGLRVVVVALTLSIVAPLGVASVISVQRTWRRQLENVDRQNIATARAVSVAIDTDIETTTAALEVFGALHALDVPDVPAFDSLARRLIGQQPHWSALLLADLHGRMLAVAPAGDVEQAGSFMTGWAQTVAATQKFVVSNLFEIPGLNGHFVMIAVPIVRDGRVRLALGARVTSDSLGDILRQQQVPPNGAVSLIDGAYRTVARTRQEQQYVGIRVNQAFIDLATRIPQGSWHTDTRDGTPVYAAFSRSPLTGLTVGLALPRQEVDGPIRRILWTLAAAWVAILGGRRRPRPCARPGDRARDADRPRSRRWRLARDEPIAPRRRGSPRSTTCPPVSAWPQRRSKPATASATRRAG